MSISKSLWNHRIVKNLSYITFSKSLNKIFFMILTILISRRFGVEGVGAYGLIFAFTGFIFLFSSIGDQVFIRDVINSPKCIRKFWGNFLVLKSLNSLVAYIFVVVITVYFMPETIRQPILLTGFILLCNIFSDPAVNVLISYQKIRPMALTIMIGDLTIVSASAFFILLGKGLSWIVIAFAIGELTKAVILNFILIRKFSKPIFKLDIKLCVKWVKNGFYFIMQRQFGAGLFRTDIFIISLVSGLYATGIYQAPYKIAMNVDIIPFVLGAVFYPYYTSVNKVSFEKLKGYYMRYKSFFIITGIMLSLFLLIFAKQIILVLYGKTFLESVSVLRVLIISTFFFSLNQNNTVLLNATGKEKTCFAIFLFIFLLNLFLDIILIKVYGVMGVALATVICSIIYFVITEVYVKRVFKNKTKTF